jgi:sugar phosphate isomerase/epimerase
MLNLLTRRAFLIRSTAAAAGGALAAIGPQPSPGAERKKRRARAEARPALTLACRDPHLKLTGRPDCWSALKSLGAEGVEATIDERLALPVLFHPERKYSADSPAAIEQLAADAKAAGCRITALCMYNRFEERPELELEWGTKVAKAAQALGVKAIRIDVVPHKLQGNEFLDFSAGVLKKLLAATESTGVGFGIENHGGTTNDPEFLQRLFDRVGSSRLGLTLDTGNFYWYGHPLSKVYAICETFASRVFHTHCKSIKYPADQREKRRPMGWEYGKYTCPIDEGDVDYRRVASILRKAGYSNDLCVEDESLSHFPEAERPAVLAREIRHLQSVQNS